MLYMMFRVNDLDENDKCLSLSDVNYKHVYICFVLHGVFYYIVLYHIRLFIKQVDRISVAITRCTIVQCL